MRYERWFRLAAAASVLLLLLAGGAVAAQLRATQEVRRLKDRLAALEREARDGGAGREAPATSPVAILRVAVVEPRATPAARPPAESPPTAEARPTVQGSFAVQATITNRTARTLRQPVVGLLVISDPAHPDKPAEVQYRQAVIDTLAPGDTTTVRLEGFEARDPGLRHELLVSIPAVAPEQTGGTVVKVVPRVTRAPSRAARPGPQAPAARPPAAPAAPAPPSAPAPAPSPAAPPQPTPPTPSQPAPQAPSQPAPPAPSQPTPPAPSQPTAPGATPSEPAPQAPAPPPAPPSSSQPGA